jgi:hypothetical protein
VTAGQHEGREGEAETDGMAMLMKSSARPTRNASPLDSRSAKNMRAAQSISMPDESYYREMKKRAKN